MTKRNYHLAKFVLIGMIMCMILFSFALHDITYAEENKNLQIATNVIDDTKITTISNIYSYFDRESRDLQNVNQFLQKIGYDDDFINNLSEEQLDEYTRLDSMVITEKVGSESVDKIDEESCQRTKLYFKSALLKHREKSSDGRTRFTVDSMVDWTVPPATRLVDFISINWNRSSVLVDNEQAWYTCVQRYHSPETSINSNMKCELNKPDPIGTNRVLRASSSDYSIKNGNYFYGYTNVKYDLYNNAGFGQETTNYTNHKLLHRVDLLSNESFNVFCCYAHRAVVGEVKIKYNKTKGWHAGFGLSAGTDKLSLVDMYAEVSQ